ncbi:MAG TPA: hypothetical protein VJ756_19120 [Terriglobales bacterium]|nr:hypothetical protein [Terriglobales bacterium]
MLQKWFSQGHGSSRAAQRLQKSRALALEDHFPEPLKKMCGVSQQSAIKSNLSDCHAERLLLAITAPQQRARQCPASEGNKITNKKT